MLQANWHLHIGGQAVDPVEGERINIENPATGETIAEAPSGSKADINRAVEAAEKAFEKWRWTPAQERAAILYDAADRLENHQEELVHLETLECGKPLDQSESDVLKAIEYLRFYAGGADKFYSETVRDSPSEVYKKIYEPHGVVGIVIPWNWPPLHTVQFTAVALATGNTVVLKPAPETPLSSLRIADLLVDVLPDGTLNVVSGGTEPGIAVTNHEDVSMLAFTGHDRTGEKVLKAAAERIVPSMLELGGKNAEIVFPDADLEKAVPTAVCNAFYNSGQACSDTERLLVHADVYDEFLAAFADAVEELTVGDGLEPDTQVGPLINERQLEKVESARTSALENGAKIVVQADVPREKEYKNGYWAAPTVLDGVTPDMAIACDEVFGPLVSVIPFESEREAVDIANDVPYGLTGTIWTTDLSRAHRLVSHLEVGMVAVNDRTVAGHALPFGGYKRSGIGRKSDFTEAMREFTRVKSLHIDLDDEPIML